MNAGRREEIRALIASAKEECGGCASSVHPILDALEECFEEIEHLPRCCVCRRPIGCDGVSCEVQE